LSAPDASLHNATSTSSASGATLHTTISINMQRHMGATYSASFP
jgi:hypothetical protein